ncbi:NAD(P)-dependent oxidoreductase [Dyadobacter sp. CY347]|uniref:NAD-dependent epimerase/dehydratase family protein n=1 Tax=Dyadobacter sp. CY347 TaxID=2909336 RepID=UPI001F17E31C|nr:NAD(P)-dependent oxidoreductase [Dyadobacter sp. CY347]MCF2489296.1 NAD(P)-dependent oxidoreductase [Dyadobacter sp. CY347]
MTTFTEASFGNVAIIGSSSFLAQYLIKELGSENHITGYGRNNIAGLKNHILFDMPSTNLDLESLVRFDHIIYCAGSGIQSGKEEKFVFDLNAFLPIQIALKLEALSYKGTFTTFGSYFEIGDNAKQIAFSENGLLSSMQRAPNAYVVSKRLLSRFFQSANLNIKFYHLILPTVYGKGENTNRLVPYLLNSLLKDETPKLTSGTQTRQYVHARDVAVIVSKLINSQAKSGIYNVPCCETIQVKDIVATIYRALDRQHAPNVSSLDRYDESMKYLALDSSKLMMAIPGSEPKISIVDSVQEYIS